jgi:N,N'-diacetylchitobiose transport system substrate-binding protein
MRTRVFVAAVAAVTLGVVAATASASGQHKQAGKITVWLQVDAQSGWPDIVAAANAQFQKDHPGTTVDVQYQTWTDHLQKFDATLAGGNSPDVIEMGNTEMTKYMAAGAFADISASKSSFDNSANWLKGLAASGVYGGKLYGRLARRHLPDRRLQQGRNHQASDQSRRVHREREEARGEERERQGLLTGLRRRY